ncbi:MAG: flagellar hook-associated protein FlgK [Microthrixaceae bacterium]
MSSFGGLNTALSGLLAHRRAIDAIGNNIANVNTPGFTRRTVTLKPSVGAIVPSRFNLNSDGNSYGVEVGSIDRVRDAFLDAKARTEMGNKASTAGAARVLGNIEALFPEPSDTGLGSQLADLWNAFDTAANNPADTAQRSIVLVQAQGVAARFAKSATDLADVHDNLANEAAATVVDINTTADQIAKLNSQIRLAVTGGAEWSALADQRDALVDKLTGLTGATVRDGEFGQVNVVVGNIGLVTGEKAEHLVLDSSAPLPPPYTGMPFTQTTLRWERGGYAVADFGGSLSATLTGLNDTVPRYLAQLNGLAASVVNSVNTLHRTGQGGDPVNDVNLDFFDPAGVTAQTMALSTQVDGQPNRIALGAVGSGGLDGSVGHQLGAIANSSTGPDAAYRSMLANLGIETDAANQRATMQAQVATDAASQRAAVSGVNLDEEMTNLVLSQHAYEASARLMTSIDEMLDTLINRTGLVGRA